MTTALSTARVASDSHGLPPWLARAGHHLFRFRDLLFPVVLGSAVLGIRPVLAGGRPETDLVVDAIGIAVAMTGQLLRVLVIGLAFIKRGGRNRRVYAKDLVEEGLFAHSRNPLYVGNLLVIAGLAIVHGSPVLIGVVVPTFCLAYVAIVAAEEGYLRERFGTPTRPTVVAYRASSRSPAASRAPCAEWTSTGARCCGASTDRPPAGWRRPHCSSSGS